MHSNEEKAAFLVLRANGWSLAKISNRLNIPKSTLFHWETEHRAQIHMVKCIHVEKLQEKYLPSFEEELQHLSSYLARIETALAKHNFDSMRPEYLLQAALHLRTRLNKIRTDLPMQAPIESVGLEPLPVAGCISRSEVNIWTAGEEQPETPPLKPPANGHQVDREILSAAPLAIVIAPSSNGSPEKNGAHQNGTFRHENGEGSKLDGSPSASSSRKNETAVPFSIPAPADLNRL